MRVTSDTINVLILYTRSGNIPVMKLIEKHEKLLLYFYLDYLIQVV